MQCLTEWLKAAMIRYGKSVKHIIKHNFDFISNDSMTEQHPHAYKNPAEEEDMRIENLSEKNIHLHEHVHAVTTG